MFCWHCGGDASEPNHRDRCDGRQGRRDALEPVPRFEPLLVAGAAPETYATSEAASVSVEESKDTQRAAVYVAIRSAGQDGRTDDELQQLLGLDGSSERPRRWELWKLDQIRILRDADGRPVRRLTRTQRRAVVWVAA